jgi:hypothetical protein
MGPVPMVRASRKRLQAVVVLGCLPALFLMAPPIFLSGQIHYPLGALLATGLSVASSLPLSLGLEPPDLPSE